MITPRTDWGARSWRRRQPRPVNSDLLIAVDNHHAMAHRPPGDITTDLFGRRIQSFHQHDNNWSDCAYSYILGRDGAVLEVRGLEWDQFAGGSWPSPDKRHRTRGAGGALHAYDLSRDPDHQVISILWQTGGDEKPPAVQVAAAARLHDHLRAVTGRPLLADAHGSHRVKACPGRWVSALVAAGAFGPPACATGDLLLHGEAEPDISDLLEAVPRPARTDTAAAISTRDELVDTAVERLASAAEGLTEIAAALQLLRTG